MAKQLFVHIGIGKAGSTAIQNFLRDQRELLLQQQVFYWGLHLEFAGSPSHYQWQAIDQIPLFQSLPDQQAFTELLDVLRGAVELLPDHGIALWSQESIYQRPSVYLRALQVLRDEGDVDVVVVAFARDHLSYALSAYKQWGIRHKHYSGPVLSFRDWSKRYPNMLHYGLKLFHWHQALGSRLILFNYQSCSNVVDSFLSVLPPHLYQCLRVCLDERRPNCSPDDSLLLLQAVFNSQYHDSVSPATFDAFVERFPQLLASAPINHLDLAGLLPTQNDLEHLCTELDADIQLVNMLLLKRGHPSLVCHLADIQNAPRNGGVDAGNLLFRLIALVLDQDQQIRRLEALLGCASASGVSDEYCSE